jgi:nucleoredoxin
MRSIHVLLGCLAFVATIQAEEPAPVETPSRTWTSVTGRTIDAHFRKESYGTVYLDKADGKTIMIRVAQLSRKDRDYIRARKGHRGSTTATRKTRNDSVFAGLFDKSLVSLKGKEVKTHKMTTNPDYYAFYFSASWCGPCHKFTPKLVEMYENSEGLAGLCEVVLVSSDRDKKSMEKYMKHANMPWPALAFAASRTRDVRKYAGPGIPCLVLVDKQGKVISDSYVDGRYTGPHRVLDDIKALFKKEGKKSQG